MNKKIFTLLILLGTILLILNVVLNLLGNREWIYYLIGFNAIILGWIGIIRINRKESENNSSGLEEK
jgi:hypothetical protein